MLPILINSQTNLKHGFGHMRREISELTEILAARRSERTVREIKYQLAAVRFETAAIRYAYLCRKAGFKEDQPRWPKGSGDDSGRWSGGAGTTAPSNEPSANPKSGGHHFVPGELYRNEPLKPETRKVFEGAKTGPIPGQPHGYDEEHVAYNKAVREAFEKFKVDNGIARSEDMTPDQARNFVDEIRASSDSRIRGFNMKIFWRQFRFFMRGRGRGFE